MSRRGWLAGIAATVGLAAALAAGYAAAGSAGLVDAATVAAVGVLLAARAAVQGREPGPVRVIKKRWDRTRTTAVSAVEFPAYRKIASDLSWGMVSWRHYEYGVSAWAWLAVAGLAAAVAAYLIALPFWRRGRL